MVAHDWGGLLDEPGQPGRRDCCLLTEPLEAIMYSCTKEKMILFCFILRVVLYMVNIDPR